jgi:hypothetical protein
MQENLRASSVTRNIEKEKERKLTDKKRKQDLKKTIVEKTLEFEIPNISNKVA